ncbi:hypothetical protein LGQ03_10655 [Loktanella sp. TSTF-M6]|uniref:Uncharacterized protein n=1 Tax=Loktanella gaetbuli TaxID=2881335 RepID=A0ABS8BVD9_9RHOB|nr:hypothetical protein [Loktanella gaetbuli]MCB5199700.1 hypothetical protein [Loktanella gaetbuli]
MLQKQLRPATLSTAGGTFARLVYSAPLTALLALIYASATDQATTPLPPHFWGGAALDGASQILATLCVVTLFIHRHFAVGVTFKGAKVVLSARVAVLILGESLPTVAWLALLIGLPGVLPLSDEPQATGLWYSRLFNRAAALGLGYGKFFALSAVGYCGASHHWLKGTRFSARSSCWRASQPFKRRS